jgi:hypothetical protein
MPIKVATTRASLATTYVGAGTWIGVATGDPGTTATPSAEASGGSPAYARKQTTWGATTGGSSTGSEVVIDAPAGTYTYVILASAATTGAANMVDNVAITPVVLNAQGQIRITPSVTIS